MKKSTVELCALILSFLLPTKLTAQELLIFGGRGHDTFLGCLNCSELDGNSICNQFGAGNSFNGDSIFNSFGRFGSEFSHSSPWNKFAISEEVPVLVDRNGQFYGYFTINHNRIDSFEFAASLASMHEVANGELDLLQRILCENLHG